MFGNTVPRDYTATIRHWPDAKKAAFEDHDVTVRAYDLFEAMVTSTMQFETDHGQPSEHGGKVKTIGIRPAGTSTADLLKALMKGTAS